MATESCGIIIFRLFNSIHGYAIFTNYYLTNVVTFIDFVTITLFCEYEFVYVISLNYTHIFVLVHLIKVL